LRLLHRARQRIASFDPLEDENVKIPVVSDIPGREEIIDHPVRANGTASFQLNFTYEDSGYGDVDQGVGSQRGGCEFCMIPSRWLHHLSLFVWYLLRRPGKCPAGAQPGVVGLVTSALVYSLTSVDGGNVAGFWLVHFGCCCSAWQPTHPSKRSMTLAGSD